MHLILSFRREASDRSALDDGLASLRVNDARKDRFTMAPAQVCQLEGPPRTNGTYTAETTPPCSQMSVRGVSKHSDRYNKPVTNPLRSSAILSHVGSR